MKPITGDRSPLVLGEFLPYRLSILTNTISAALARQYEERFRLTIPQWRLMAVLGLASDLSSSELAEETGMDKVSVSRALSGLVKAGRVLRREDRDDARRLRARLSAKGRGIYEQIVPIARNLERELLAELSDRDRDELDRLLGVLGDAARTLPQPHEREGEAA